MKYSETIPVQYQEGKAVFMGMDVMVDPRVLIPRPETELLVDVTTDLCRERSIKEPFVLDVGTGSGIIPLGLIRRIRGCRVVGTDVSPDALSVARANLKRYDHDGRVALVLSDMFAELAPVREGVFDCVVSNPPYVSAKDYEGLDAWVKAEPKIALYAGDEGMDHLEAIAGQCCRFLKPGGFVAVEVGYDQSRKVKECFSRHGFRNISAFKDLNGYERVIAGWKHG